MIFNSRKKIIFDFGANKGQNLNYFLQKADFVVCVEANPILTERIKKNYYNHINNNSLFVENVCLSEINGFQNFYISKKNDVLSTAVPPEIIKKYIRIRVPSINPSSLVRKYIKKLSLKNIEYIKVDIEGYDHIILDNLFKNNIYPQYISTEMSHPKILKLILNSPYKSFKFSEGSQIGIDNKKIKFQNIEGKIMKINFTEHCSGPYGDDMPKKYYTKDSVVAYFLNNGLGWRDICCSLEVKEYEKEILYNWDIHLHQKRFAYHLREIFPAFKRMLVRQLANLVKK